MQTCIYMHLVASFILHICSSLTVSCPEAKEDSRSDTGTHTGIYIHKQRHINKVEIMAYAEDTKKIKRPHSVFELLKVGWVYTS